MVQDFSRQLGYPVNVSRTPNGILVDVNIADKGIGPTHEAFKNAADATFGNDPTSMIWGLFLAITAAILYIIVNIRRKLMPIKGRGSARRKRISWESPGRPQ